MSRITIFLSVCVLVAVTASRIVDATQAVSVQTTTKPATQQPAAQPPAAQPPTAQPPSTPAHPPAGYAGSDACVLCHGDQEKSIAHSRHGQTKDPRSPAATLGCESCHGPGQAHIDDDAKGHIKKFSALKPAEINETCLTCHNRGNHAAWEGSTHEARNLACTTCHSVHKPVSFEHQLVKPTETQLCATCHRQQVVKTERAVAHMPVREGKLSCSSCHNPHGSISNVKNLKVGSSVNELCTSCHAEMRGPMLWEHAAGPRELHDVPRSARLVERSHAERTNADAVSALSHRDQTSLVRVRQCGDHDEQEQSDVRTVVRQLPPEHPRVEPSRRASSSCGSRAGQDVCDHCFSHVFAVR